MGLFDFIKKSHRDPLSASVVSNKPGERTSVFKGDLAILLNSDAPTEKELSIAADLAPSYTSENMDSVDSVVYMSFAPAMRNIWVCPECGTNNEESMDGCIVCSLKK